MQYKVIVNGKKKLFYCLEKAIIYHNQAIKNNKKADFYIINN